MTCDRGWPTSKAVVRDAAVQNKKMSFYISDIRSSLPSTAVVQCSGVL